MLCRFLLVCSSTLFLRMTLNIKSSLTLIWLKFITALVRRLIMAAKGEVIARIDGAVKFLAQRRFADCTIIIWHLAFDETKKGWREQGLGSELGIK